MTIRKLFYALTGLVLSSAVAFGANLSLLSGPQYSEPSQILATVNTLIRNINSGVQGSIGGFVGPVATTAGTIQVLGTASIAANSLTAGQSVRVTCWGTGTATGTNTLTIQVGSATAFAVAGSATTAGVFKATVLIQKTGASTQSIWSEGIYNSTLTLPTIIAATQTDTAAIPVKCSGTSTTAANFTLNGMIAEQIK
jgi:hypothetical protein